MSRRPCVTIPLALAASVAIAAATAHASDCSNTSTGLVPLSDLGTGFYLGQFRGGLYPNGSNQMPPAHHAAGRARALAVEPLDTSGHPDPAGRYILMSIGMSNTTQEWCGGAQPNCQPGSFMGQAAVHPAVNHDTLVIIDGARGGQTAATWDDPNDANYERIRTQILQPQGLSEAQVQIVWVKVANAGPNTSLPAQNADAYTLLTQMGDIARALRTRYPNLRLAFFSSRIYAGYADTALNPEPYAYESAFAVKWLIEAQIRQMATGQIDPRAGDLDADTVAPWIAWGPYLWADGLSPRSDGLTWQCTDFANDGTHPSIDGRTKVGTLLMDFMLSSPHAAPWFRSDFGDPCPGDLNADQTVDFDDLTLLLAAYGVDAGGDLDNDGDTDFGDLLILLNNYGQTCR